MGPNPNGPLSVSCDRATRISGGFGVRGPWVLLEISWIYTCLYTVIYIHREPIQTSGTPNDWLFGTTQIDHWFGISYDNWLVVSTHLKHISQIGSLAQVGLKKKRYFETITQYITGRLYPKVFVGNTTLLDNDC